MDERRIQVGILPAAQHRARARLFAALEEAYPVRFDGREEHSARGLDAIVAFGAGDTPALGLPTLTMHGKESTRSAPRLLALAVNGALARPLRGARLTDAYATPLGDVGSHEVTVAELDHAPAWVIDPHSPHPHAPDTHAPHPYPPHRHAPDTHSPNRRWRVACAPEELGPEEALRERLRPGRSLALLALAHFLAGLTAHLRPRQPPLHAAFVIDDPNLRRPRYGHLDYAELVSEARLHGYHVSVAMVPLDARLAHPGATRIFREGADHLSLCVHGNDHRGPELGRARSDADALALVAQALRRTAAFERRTGVAVDRVMAPPHERLSEPMARALRACGFRAVTTTRPYPWVADSSERSWLARPPTAGPLAAWRPIDLVAGGLPVLLRADFRLHPREDLVLRAFLGQPLILYGHHDLLAGGPGALAEAAAQIDGLGDVRWSSLAAIAGAYGHEHGHGGRHRHGHASTNAQIHPLSDAPAGERRDPHICGAGPSASSRLTPLLRRLASEGRDRAAGLTTRTRSS
jgi:hypothetical protein